LVAFAKIALTEDIIASSVPDDPYLARELLRYFPEPMRERFAADIEAHRLRREIIGTQLANSLINRGGPTLLVAVRDRTGTTVADLTRAYAATRDSFALQELHAEIEALDAKIPGQLQLELFTIVQDVLVDRLGWFIRNLDPTAGLAGIIDHVRAGLVELSGALDGDVAGSEVATRRETSERLRLGGVPPELAERVALLPALARAADVVFLADRAGRPLTDAGVAYAAVGARFGFARLDAMLGQIVTTDYYDSLALQKARDSLETAQRDLACAVLDRGGRSGGHRCLGASCRRPHHRNCGSGGKDPSRPQAEHGQGDSGGEPPGRSGAGITQPPKVREL
jgi:glutamate dehydrogenase